MAPMLGRSNPARDLRQNSIRPHALASGSSYRGKTQNRSYGRMACAVALTSEWARASVLPLPVRHAVLVNDVEPHDSRSEQKLDSQPPRPQE